MNHTSSIELAALADRLAELLPKLRQRFAEEVPEELRASLSGELSRITPHQLEIVRFLNDRGEVTMREITEAFRVTSSAATQQVERLLRLGLVERVTDGGDRRYVRVRPTAIAPDLVRRHQEVRRRAAEAVLTPLGPERARTLVELLEEVTRSGQEHEARDE
jgi:DNA-binding MarR family transcriptional regulator